MEVETDPRDRNTRNNVMCLFTDPEGTPLSSTMYIPQDVGRLHRPFLNISSTRFSIVRRGYHMLSIYKTRNWLCHLELTWRKTKSEERVISIIYQPQAVFRICLVNRCSSTIAGHPEAVLSVAFNPDGQHLAIGSGDTIVRLWDLNTKTPMLTSTGKATNKPYETETHKQAGELQCWDPETGKSSGYPLIGHEKGLLFILGTRNDIYRLPGHTIEVWETTQGKLICELKGHGRWVNSIALSTTEYVLQTGAFDHTGRQYSSPEEMQKVALEKDNKMKGNSPERLVSGSDDFTMFLWKRADDNNPKLMTGHQQLVNHVCFSPDGQWIASASFDKSVKLSNGTAGEFITTFHGHVGAVYQMRYLPGHADEVYAVDWSLDGEKVASGGEDRVWKLWMG
ncbi:hypothetical protein SLE2022_136870 [Rubroshorea leprosula]